MLGDHEEAIEQPSVERGAAVAKRNQQLVEVCNEDILFGPPPAWLASREAAVSRKDLHDDDAALVRVRQQDVIADDAQICRSRRVLEPTAQACLDDSPVGEDVDEASGRANNEPFVRLGHDQP